MTEPETTPEIDQQTFHRFQSGDREAALAIVQAYHHRLLAFLRIQTRDPDLAEDLAQEAFLRLIENRTRIRAANRVGSWLFTVASRLCIREGQRARQYRPNEAASDLPDAQHVSAEENLHHGQRDGILFQALETLGEKERRLLTLRYFGGLSIRELATVMEMPMGSVGVTISRAQHRLRKWLEARGYQPEDLL